MPRCFSVVSYDVGRKPIKRGNVGTVLHYALAPHNLAYKSYLACHIVSVYFLYGPLANVRYGREYMYHAKQCAQWSYCAIAFITSILLLCAGDNTETYERTTPNGYSRVRHALALVDTNNAARDGNGSPALLHSCRHFLYALQYPVIERATVSISDALALVLKCRR